MRIEVAADSTFERLGMLAGMVPTPIFHMLHTIVLSRVLLVSLELGVFAALENGGLDLDALSRKIDAAPRALQKLLDAAVGAGYLRLRGNTYELSKLARTWLLESSPRSLHGSLLFGKTQWDLVAGLETFVRTGKARSFYDGLDAKGWATYEKAMQDNGRMMSPELVRRIPSLARATTLLDLGGGHGHHAVALLRKYPRLHATVMDLPQALEAPGGEPLRKGMEDRLAFVAGDALEADLGDARWDAVLMGQLVHHFDDPTNRALVARAARSLKPGGLLAIQEWIRPESAHGAQQEALLGDLFFSLFSQTGTWTFSEMDAWATAAGLKPLKRVRLLTVPGMGLFVARKP